MMMKIGIYQTIKPQVVIEKHGGSNIKHNVYWNLCFYPNNIRVGLFGGDRDFIQPYKNESFDLKGEIIMLTKNYLELFIVNPYTNIKKFYKGEIEGGKLYLKYFQEDKPEEVFEDVFEYIGTGDSEA